MILNLMMGSFLPFFAILYIFHSFIKINMVFLLGWEKNKKLTKIQSVYLVISFINEAMKMESPGIIWFSFFFSLSGETSKHALLSFTWSCQ